jgi:hypothetical protein
MSAPLVFPAADVFIETGYGNGETLEDVVNGPYRTIHSVEINADVAARARERWKPHPRVQIHAGSSPDVLPALVDPDRDTVFWLDAHYSGGAYDHDANPVLDSKYGQCPLLAELAVIRAVGWRTPPRIFIDDVGFFRDPEAHGADRAQFPTLEQIQAALPPGYRMQVKRQWWPRQALSNFHPRYFGRERYLQCDPPA